MSLPLNYVITLFFTGSSFEAKNDQEHQVKLYTADVLAWVPTGNGQHSQTTAELLIWHLRVKETQPFGP